MLKTFSIFAIVIFFTTIAFSQQPTVYIPLVVTETTFTQNMAVGLDAAATNCIDLALGEAEAPPPPPPGAFHIVFDLAPYGCGPVTVWKDYRNAPSFPYTGTVQHTLSLQRSTTGSIVSIQYTLPNEAQMTITDAINGLIYTSGALTGTGTFDITGIGASLTTFWLTMSYMAVPVELTSFVGSVQGDGVVLNWTTATELNNQGFEIERSTVSEDWAKIGYVPGFGTTTEPRSYSFVDNNVSGGTYYYRLKQLDFNGEFEYSDEIEVLVDLTPTNFELFQNYPNPFNPTTRIKYQLDKNSFVTLKVYDILGNEVATLVNEDKPAGIYEINFSAEDLPSGTYLARLTGAGSTKTIKMTLVK